MTQSKRIPVTLSERLWKTIKENAAVYSITASEYMRNAIIDRVATDGTAEQMKYEQKAKRGRPRKNEKR